MTKTLTLLLALGLGASEAAFAQTTTITATNEKLGGYPIATGTVALTAVDRFGIAISFADASGSQNGAGQAYQCAITNGAITGAIQNDGTVAGVCQVPDSTTTTPDNILWAIRVCDTTSGKRTSGSCFVLQQVIGVAGTTWPLDHYGPQASTTNVQPVVPSGGVGAPVGACGTFPAVYLRTDVPSAYICVANAWVQMSGSGASGATGSAGAAGAAATITVGSTTTIAPGTPATVVNVGTSSAAILQFSIPQGMAGAAGSGGSGASFPAGTGLVSVTSGTPGIAVAGTDYTTPAQLAASSTANQTYSANASNLTTGTVAAARIPTLNQNTTGNAATATLATVATTAQSVNSTGSTVPGSIFLGDASATIPALSAGGAGFSAPLTGNTPFLWRLPQTAAAGVVISGAPSTTARGVSESVLSILPLAGSGAGITTGPISSNSGDLACFTGSAGQLSDCTISPASFGMLSGSQAWTGTNTFSVSPVVPTATAGDSSTKAASTAFVANAISGLSSGGSGSGTVNSGTQYSLAYYGATGTAVSGVTPFTGLGYFSASAAPAVATSAQVVAAIGNTYVYGTTNIAGGALGSIPTQNAGGSTVFLTPNTTATRKFVREQGTGTVGAAPAWDTLVSADIPNNAANTSGTAANASALNTLPATGGGVAIPTGPSTSTTGDLVIFTGSAGQVADSGILASSLAGASEGTVAFSATPAFGCQAVQTLTLTGNVTSFTWPACGAGKQVVVNICENSTGGFTVPVAAAPSNVRGFGGVTSAAATTANKCSTFVAGYSAVLSAFTSSPILIQ